MLLSLSRVHTEKPTKCLTGNDTTKSHTTHNKKVCTTALALALEYPLSHIELTFTMASAIFTAQRILLGTSGTITAYATYKAKYDPPHVIWDLDHTLLCSVTPLPSSALAGYDYFDQIDDDFPFEKGIPNTRSYWRPGARTMLQLFRFFTIQHVFTAAQETYTENILQQMDRSLFHTIIHRDEIPQPKGKDLLHIVEKACPNKLHRCILWDDRTKNFRPQNGENGVHVVPFLVEKSAGKFWPEYREMARWMGIAFVALLAPDVRSILPYFQSKEHQKTFSSTTEKTE
jgi:NLI interacting factor-like phosphatase